MRAVGTAGKRLTVSTDLMLEVLDLGQCWVLTTGAEEIAQRVDLNTSSAALVEEGEGLLEVGGLRLFRHGCVSCVRCLCFSGWLSLCGEM